MSDAGWTPDLGIASIGWVVTDAHGDHLLARGAQAWYQTTEEELSITGWETGAAARAAAAVANLWRAARGAGWKNLGGGSECWWRLTARNARETKEANILGSSEKADDAAPQDAIFSFSLHGAAAVYAY